ncbi:hypothetical protein HPB50_027205 [Hyalomma asiaticum]|uniref:Uncharacterized protein n=1 Tax=Hyalomma asiaticum TaxID=266040 RepID=A0ACB7TS88_HYAAI|nr:hypothetical protein HPB50_027205 [Hyalomma asiaticum]
MGLESGTSVLTASEKPRKVNDTARRRSVFPENRRERNRAGLQGQSGEEDAESDRTGPTSLYRFPVGYCTRPLSVRDADGWHRVSAVLGYYLTAVVGSRVQGALGHGLLPYVGASVLRTLPPLW